MSRFNLSEWALRNRPLVLYFMIVLAVAGIWSYRNLGQSEDPPFTFKVMVVRTLWPGATAKEVSEQVTDRIEAKLLETGSYEFLRSYSRPGESQVFFVIKDAYSSAKVPDIWYEVRKKINDIRQTLPPGTIGPFFNDEFGETYGNIYALTGEGYDYALLRDYSKRVQLALQRVSDVGKVDLIGLQDEKIYIELSNAKIATLGIRFNDVLAAIDAQNSVVPAGSFETDSDRIYLRATGAFDSLESIRNLSIRAGDRLFKLADIANIYRGFADPPQAKVRFGKQDAVAIAVSMNKGGDILRLGSALDAAVKVVQQTLPVGMELHLVADQPKAVSRSVTEFVHTLGEAVIIVLAVSFLSLGWRTGLVVALSIPLVLAMTFAAMKFFGIDLHKISLGALVIALGLLVDDAIIAVEMMAVKLEQGYDRIRAAAFAYSSTAFPMLSGTLVTAAGFLPIATAASGTGEYTRSIFQVVVLALLLSWIAAVVFIPYLGYRLLPDAHGAKGEKAGGGEHHEVYDGPFYNRLRAAVVWCVDRRWTVIAVTVAAFVLSMAAFKLVPQQFFPDSTRLELMVDLKLPEGSSQTATDVQAHKLEEILSKDEDIERFVAYVGSGAPRFYLPLDQQLPQASFSQFVVTTKSIEARERVRARLITLFQNDFPELRGRVLRLENGPPVGFPVQFRVSGEDYDTVRRYAKKVAEVMRADGRLANVNLDADEPSKIIRASIDQERARVLGVSSQDLANFLQSSLSGARVSIYREKNNLIEMLLRGPGEERARLSLLKDLAVPTANGRAVPLAQIATLEYGLEDGIIWRRNRLPTITARGDIYGHVQPPEVAADVLAKLDAVKAELPPGYRIEIGGTVEDSGRGQRSVAAGVPLFVFVVLTVLMLQLRSFSRTFLVVATAPLGMIGVTLALLLFRVPFGFVAMLGVIALFGMIMRNSVILVDQIDQDIAAGHNQWQAIIDATVRRFRPIVLTAAAAVLAMIPLSRSVFFGPMAVAIMGGLVVATALTVLFLPALYAAWFRVKRPPSGYVHEGGAGWPGDEIA